MATNQWTCCCRSTPTVDARRCQQQNCNYRIENISKPNATPRIYTVVGYICETDTFGSNRRIAEINEGDFLIFHNAGAYCFSMASNYNSRLRPAEVLWINGKAELIRARETFEDLIKGQIEVNVALDTPLASEV